MIPIFFPICEYRDCVDFVEYHAEYNTIVPKLTCLGCVHRKTHDIYRPKEKPKKKMEGWILLWSAGRVANDVYPDRDSALCNLSLEEKRNVKAIHIEWEE